MSIWVLLKFFVEMNHYIIDFMTINQLDPLHRLGENLKSSPTGKFTVYVVKGIANSNGLINLSCRRVATYLRGFKWFIRR
jgi:hypothetical protein